jgi:GTPase
MRQKWLYVFRFTWLYLLLVALQVNVVEFKERKKGKDYIRCELVVEKSTQKGIILGAKGSAIKALSSSARSDIESFLERPIYLELEVRVEKDWRKDATKLRSYGY